jgi:hypothetical protein
MTVVLKQSPGKKQNLRRAPSVKFWLLTPTGNKMLRLAMLKVILRKKKKKKKKRRNNNRTSSCRTQQKSNHRLQQVADYQHGERLKEHKYSSFCQSRKGGPRNCFSTFWIQQYSTVGYCYLVGLNIPTEISGSFW